MRSLFNNRGGGKVKQILTPRQKMLLGLSNAYDKLCICNGCRPESLSKVIPDALEKILAPLFDLIFFLACSNHDIVYLIGGVEKDRKKADKYFKFQMNKALAKSSLYNHSEYKSLEKTKWYQIKLKNVGRGIYNIGPALWNGTKATGTFIKKQYLKIKVFEYYLLVRKFGKDSFNFKSPMDYAEQFPSYLPLNESISKYNKTFTYDGRIHLESEHKKRMV